MISLLACEGGRNRPSTLRTTTVWSISRATNPNHSRMMAARIGLTRLYGLICTARIRNYLDV